MSCDKFSVLYTHQKTKKAKTWQDGILKVIGTKAVLCDEDSKTLDSLFVRRDQVAPGEELESERYLITIDERLHPSADHTHGVTSKTQEKEVKDWAGLHYQPGKRKRQCFQPPTFNQEKPVITGYTEPEVKKPRDEHFIPPRPNSGLGMTNRPPSNTDFSTCTVLIPRNERVTVINATGKENRFASRGGPPAFTFSTSDTENKRDTSQILALFTSCKDIPQPKMALDGQSTKVNDLNSAAIEEKRLISNWHGTADSNSSQMNTVKLCAQTNSISEAADLSLQSNTVNKDSLDQELETSQDLGDSLNLSPDSFAACSSETRLINTLLPGGDSQENNGGDVAGGGTMCEDSTQESAFSKSPCDIERQNEVWFQNDSESVSPLMRLLSSVENDFNESDPPTCVDLKEDRGHVNAVRDSSLLDDYNFQGRDSANVEHRSSGLHPSDFPNLYSTQQSAHMKTNRFPSHPGSLFAYSGLQSQDQNDCSRSSLDSNMFEKGINSLEQWDPPSFERNGVDDIGVNFLQCEVSPEFYPSDNEKTTQWKVAPIVTTKVIPTDNRTVTAGDGHSWKGSVVSDTVKRGCPSVPMVSVQRKDVYSQPSNGDQRAPSSDFTWIDSISSSNAHNESPCLLSTQGFATSESIALSSTEGFIRNSQLTEEKLVETPEFVQRVPRLSRRRAPLVTAPPEDQDTPCTIPPNTDVYRERLTGTCATELPGVCRKTTSTIGKRSIGLSQRETTEPSAANVGNLTEKGNSTLLGSCRRVGLRRVGLGCTRDLPDSQNAMSQTRQQSSQKSDGYRPPSAPGFVANTLSGDRSMAGELCFPSAEECDGSVTPTRHVTVPVTFENVMQYRQLFKAALREHLNVVLFELARTYHAALQKVDVSGFGAHEQGNRQSSDGPCCPHGQARLRAVKKDGANKGRLFYTCPGTGQAQCKFFKWADEYQANKSGSKGTKHNTSNKLTLSSSESLMAFFRSYNVAFYSECHLIRKNSDAGKGKFGAKAKKWGRQRNGDADSGKKGLYLELSRKDHSSTYSKDDIWIISKTLSFNPDSTFIASSAYYGPSSSGELEILPISGYSPSNWQSGETVHALLACNAGTELTCISNIEEHVKMQNMPVLPFILQRGQGMEPNIRNPSRVSSFVPPTLRTSGGQLDLPLEVTESLAEEMILRFNLNKDQSSALLSCANMFNPSIADGSSLPVLFDTRVPFLLLSLLNRRVIVELLKKGGGGGVFGAGKSFLLAVVVLYLVELFKASDAFHQQSNTASSWKILVSSTTNVAVDRILLGLLELGFEEFVRVGSIRKIAKPVLPYSVHSTGNDSQELKELQSLLKTELTPSERTHVRKGIEQHKLGENKRKLSQVRVVGVTCAACVFPCLHKLKFPVLLLDECSQMTEPASLLPMARFECRKLVLVGDPKQLSPTIQGSEPEHETGLEQTMFDRLMKMGYEPTLLRTQYRCHPAISGISNRLFYENKLFDGVTAEDRTPVVDVVPTLCFYNVAKGKEKCGRDGSYYNEEEAKFVVFLIECLLESGVEPAQIGVITLYKSQLHTISNNLTASRATSHAELKSIQISTVDAFQGGEKDLIILSCVRTDHIGFIDCDRRTNVALSRAKRHLLIVGNLKMLSCNTVWGKVIDYCREFPGGLCNSQDFMKKWRKEDVNDLRESPVIKESCPPETTEKTGQIDNGKERNRAPSISKPVSAPALSKETETNATQCTPEIGSLVSTNSVSLLPSQAPCSDILENGTTEDDSDDELPTFDIFSSFGIEPV
ncbi:Protein zgrf1 [Desmophyllum pertusum]|uniref:5'-3' DNA helicase ZGRF1 n=1 Tax=Desmophyllum pertusum TaxID=174260 RepID=A0A9X0CNN2_9CNID|nr:Protein zgrf1 [Desmophyllum pertusum]